MFQREGKGKKGRKEKKKKREKGGNKVTFSLALNPPQDVVARKNIRTHQSPPPLSCRTLPARTHTAFSFSTPYHSQTFFFFFLFGLSRGLNIIIFFFGVFYFKGFVMKVAW